MITRVPRVANVRNNTARVPQVPIANVRTRVPQVPIANVCNRVPQVPIANVRNNTARVPQVASVLQVANVIASVPQVANVIASVPQFASVRNNIITDKYALFSVPRMVAKMEAIASLYMIES